MIALSYTTPFQIFGVFLPFFLMFLTIIHLLILKKIANEFIEDPGTKNVDFNEYIKYPKVLRFAVISTIIVLALIIISLTVFSSGVDIFDFNGFQFIMLDQVWEIMNYLGLPFFHFAAVTMGGFGMSNSESSENR